MTEPLDHQIVTALAAQLRLIRRDAGYFTDAGEHVLSEDSPDEIPDDTLFLELLDDEETTEFQGCNRRRGILLINVAVNHPAGEVDQALRHSARLVLADIRRALAAIKPLDWVIGVTGLEIGGRTFFTREHGSRYFRPELRLRVTFTEQHRSNS